MSDKAIQSADMIQYERVMRGSNNPIDFGKQIYVTALLHVMGTFTATKFIANLTDDQEMY